MVITACLQQKGCPKQLFRPKFSLPNVVCKWEAPKLAFHQGLALPGTQGDGGMGRAEQGAARLSQPCMQGFPTESLAETVFMVPARVPGETDPVLICFLVFFFKC